MVVARGDLSFRLLMISSLGCNTILPDRPFQLAQKGMSIRPCFQQVMSPNFVHLAMDRAQSLPPLVNPFWSERVVSEARLRDARPVDLPPVPEDGD